MRSIFLSLAFACTVSAHASAQDAAPVESSLHYSGCVDFSGEYMGCLSFSPPANAGNIAVGDDAGQFRTQLASNPDSSEPKPTSMTTRPALLDDAKP